MATWSEWFKAAKEGNVPLEKYLVIDPIRDLERLYSSGLPVYNKITVGGNNYKQERRRIEEFSEKHNECWVRVYNKTRRGERYSKFPLEHFEDITYFIEKLEVDLTEFEIQLFECHENKFGGNILSDNRGTYIELVEGTQDVVGKSLGFFFHGSVNYFGRLCFWEEEKEEVPLKIKRGAKEALSYLKMSRNEFIEGYFEFIISKEGNVYFLDYKTGLG